MKYHKPNNPAEVHQLIADDKCPVMLCFVATFCGPSFALLEIIDDLFDERGDDLSLTLIELDVEDLPTLAREYAVKATPSLVMLHNGIPTASRMGTMTYDDLVTFIESEVNAPAH